jgi:hypothetical protein
VSQPLGYQGRIHGPGTVPCAGVLVSRLHVLVRTFFANGAEVSGARERAL